MYHSTGLTTSGTAPQTLAAARTPAGWIVLQARSANAGTIRIVSSDACQNGAITPTTGGTVLAAGASLTMPSFGAPLTYDLRNVYAIPSNSGDGLDISYGS